MKKKVLGALVIVFLTWACILAINEVSSTSPDDKLQQYYASQDN